MAYEQEGSGREQPPGERLALLLRGWWEEAGHASGGSRPTQQALATRLGVDQTTLSRYLNPKHTSNAPPRVVEALHAQLRAPDVELELARALCRAALEESSRQRLAGGKQVPTAVADTADGSRSTEVPGSAAGTGSTGGPGSTSRPDTAPAAGATTGRTDGPGSATGTDAPAGTDATLGTDTAVGADAADGADAGEASGRPRFRRALPALVVAAVVLAFAAGAGVRELVAPSRDVPVAGAAGAAPARVGPHEWPLLMMQKEDHHTRGRALQHLLNAHGYEVRADGFFDEETRDAVMDFQRKHDLAPDGKVGKDTWPELVKEAAPGDKGAHVLAVQELLDNVGQGGTVVSGKFTAVTAADLRFFQSNHHLPVTGRADTETWLVLLVRQLPPDRAPAYQTSPRNPASASASA
ncbi:peptidoglycan-binding protein [Streptomyces sp. WG7]|uniref:peptidoglycan-binding domain-containing protein n=1 Tax=Streptomyces sp. WG7 TaxID=3417650 RepID=UPI003CEE917B